MTNDDKIRIDGDSPIGAALDFMEEETSEETAVETPETVEEAGDDPAGEAEAEPVSPGASEAEETEGGDAETPAEETEPAEEPADGSEHIEEENEPGHGEASGADEWEGDEVEPSGRISKKVFALACAGIAVLIALVVLMASNVLAPACNDCNPGPAVNPVGEEAGTASAPETKIDRLDNLTLHLAGLQAGRDYEITRIYGVDGMLHMTRYVYDDDNGGRSIDFVGDFSEEEILNAVNKYKVGDWDGFHGENSDSADGGEFELVAIVNDGTLIHADGFGSYPDGYADFVKWADLTLEERGAHHEKDAPPEEQQG